MPLPFLHRPAKVNLNLGSEFAASVTDSLVRTIGGAIARLATADKNRVLLALASFIATQLEALEESNET